MAAKELTYSDIMKDLQARKYAPVYYLAGEEPYYIDKIANYLIDNVLTETEKDFNLDVLYGADTNIGSIIDAARRYPMMSEYRVLVVREAQTVKNMDNLSVYLEKPLSSTILVICHKNGKLDKRKKISQEIAKKGVLFESQKLKDNQLPTFIDNYMTERGYRMDSKAVDMMADFVGTDLGRMAGELEKLIITLPEGEVLITPDQIEKNIGISKDYNNIELCNAIIRRDVLKANKIVKYFIDNPKNNPLLLTLAYLFNFFSNLMLAYYAPDKSESGIAAFLELKKNWHATNYIAAMKIYSGYKTMQIISEIRMCDAKSKGVGNSSLDNGELLRELVFKILH